MRIIDLNTLSMVGGSGIAEAKVPLWWSDGTSTPTSSTTAGAVALNDGSGNATTSGSPSSEKIFTLSSTWMTNTNFAFEATLNTNSSSVTGYGALYDFTTSSVVNASQVSTTSINAVVVRSGKFNLVPSHSYGVTFWNTSSSNDVYPIDASLIVFPQ